MILLGSLAYIYTLYLILPITKNVVPLLIRQTNLFLFLAILQLVFSLQYLQNDIEILFLDGVHRINMKTVFGALFILSLVLVLFQSYTYYLKSAETFMILLTNVIAIINLIESYDWLLTIINYELINITLYLIVSMKNGSEKALSASIKYFLLSALTTSFLLLFVTLIYAITGTIHWDNMGMLWTFFFEESDIKLPLFFMLITILFKIAAAPFHNWSPDLLDAIPTVLTSWVATIPKYGVQLFLSLFSHYLYEAGSLNLNGDSSPLGLLSELTGRSSGIVYLILSVAILSIQVGSFGLSNQWRIKRFLAYSAISHIGFLLLAQGTHQIDFYIYYLIIYAFTSIGIFMILLSINSNPELILQLSGIFHQNAYVGLSFIFLLFSLMGIPPMAGFFAKLMVLASVLSAGYVPQALLAIIGSMISSVNYQNQIKIIFVNLPNESYTFAIADEISVQISIIIAFTLFFLFYPSSLLSLTSLLIFS